MNPPNLEDEAIFEWSKKVEPRNHEALTAQFILSEIELKKVVFFFSSLSSLVFCCDFFTLQFFVCNFVDK